MHRTEVGAPATEMLSSPHQTPSPTQDMSEQHRTERLVIIGGAEDKVRERRVLREFVTLAGADEARIVVVPVGSAHPVQVAADYDAAFRALGARDVTCCGVTRREEARDAAMLAILENATGVFFTGGDQMRIMSVLGGTPFDTAVHRRCADGAIIGGTSAGAAIMSSTMIVGGDTDAVRRGSVQTGPGMEFLRGVIIDQHFTQRGRIGRLLAVVAQFPHELGMGIDEDTAAIVEGHVFRVVGRGAVTVLDAGAVTFNDAEEVGLGACITLCGLTLHSLPEGRRFDLLERTSVPA
jgi:cyanophycinase